MAINVPLRRLRFGAVVSTRKAIHQWSSVAISVPLRRLRLGAQKANQRCDGSSACKGHLCGSSGGVVVSTRMMRGVMAQSRVRGSISRKSREGSGAHLVLGAISREALHRSGGKLLCSIRVCREVGHECRQRALARNHELIVGG